MSLRATFESIFQRAGSLTDDASDIAAKRELWCQYQEMKPKLQSLISDDQFQDLEKKLTITPKRKPATIMGVVRLVAVLLAVLILTPLLIMLSPLRMFHSLLQSFGVPSSHLPCTLFVRWYCRTLLLLGCIEVTVEGQQNSDKVADKEPILGMFQHSSNLDGFIIASVSSISFTWIGKRELYFIPLIGQMALLYGVFVGVDRSNREKAISSLKNAEVVMTTAGKSVGISPEGTRSKIGQLGEFKKGPFYMAKSVQSPILPIIIFGAFELLPPKSKTMTPGQVILRYLPPVFPEEYKNMEPSELSGKVKSLMLRGMAMPPKNQQISKAFMVQHYTALVVLFVVIFVFLRWIFF